MRGSVPLLLVVLVLGLGLAAPAGAVTGDYLGVSVGTLFDAERDFVPGGASQLDSLGRTGIPVARIDATWHSVEPYGPYPGFARNWVAPDRIAGALALRRIRWFPILGYATPWSTTVAGIDKAAPANEAHFASYAAGIAQRYGPGGTFWQAHPELPYLPVTAMELWNEPNLRAYWRPEPDPAVYASLYLATRAAVHEVMPQVKVITGGLSPYTQPEAFLRAMFAARPELASNLDGVGMHPYAAGPAQVMDVIVSIRNTLRSLGVGGVPIAATELGWPRPNQSPNAAFAIPDETRAGDVTLVADALPASDCNVDRLLMFTWTTSEANPVEQEDWFGLVHPDGAPTAAAGALAAAALRALPGGAPLSVCGQTPNPATPLPLDMKVSRAHGDEGRTCVRAFVRYRGLPVNRIPVEYVQGSNRASISGDDDGRTERCFSQPGRIRVQAKAGRWAASRAVTVRSFAKAAAKPKPKRSGRHKRRG